MSMAIKAATSRTRAGVRGGNLQGAALRSAMQGDPGLFGFLGDAIGTVTGIASRFLPGPLGTIAGAISSGLSGGPGNGQSVQQTVPVSSTITSFAQERVPIDINFPFMGESGAGVTLFGQQGGKGSGTALMKVNGNGNGACPAGEHPNKSSYFLKDGTFVPEGSRCVKNRRRNPLNPRAASSAISRLEGTKKAIRRIDRFSIRCRRHRRMSCKEC